MQAQPEMISVGEEIPKSTTATLWQSPKLCEVEPRRLEEAGSWMLAVGDGVVSATTWSEGSSSSRSLLRLGAGEKCTEPHGEGNPTSYILPF